MKEIVGKVTGSMHVGGVAIVCDEYGGLYVCVFEREDER